MKSISFILCKNYNHTLVGQQLLTILPKSVLVCEQWCCDHQSPANADIIQALKLDNLAYMINNYILSRQFEHVVVSCDSFSNDDLIKLISHLDSQKVHHIIFDLTDTSELTEVENLELLNSEYRVDYLNLNDGKTVKLSSMDTTNMSAFKIASYLKRSILQ